MIKIGHGIDYHIFDNSLDYLFLGGVKIFAGFGMKAHSDGDIVIHAIVDSILGALGIRDIGHFFPDTDDDHKDRESEFFLERVLEFLYAEKYEITNIDITIICDKLKIAPLHDDIKKSLIKIIKIKEINIKATTKEKMDDVGKGIGIECHAVCLIMKKEFKCKQYV